MAKRNRLGMDIGTSNIKIFSESGDKYLNEKNIIAICGKIEGPPLCDPILPAARDIFAFGDEAYEMYEKAPSHIKVSYPVKNGAIADFDNMQTLFIKFINKILDNPSKLEPTDYYIAVPTDITEVEKRAFLELAKHPKAKAKKIYVINKPISDALGSGVEVNKAQGVMVCNIGADTTEISVISLGGIVLSKAVKFGGNRLDEAIIAAVKSEYKLVIGLKSAEMLKIKLGSAIMQDEIYETVTGRHMITGLPTRQAVSSTVIYNCLIDFINQIVDNIKAILERTPPELSADIIDTGIYLTGGSSGIKDMATLINNETDLHINIANNPSESVVRGIKKIIENPQYNEIAYIPKTNILD